MEDWSTRWARRFDEWRVVPRVLVLSYYWIFAQTFQWVTQWFMDYPFNDIENQAVALAIVGFPVGVLTVMTGVLAVLSNNYFRTGRNGTSG